MQSPSRLGVPDVTGGGQDGSNSSMPDPLADLVDAARDGDREAFEELVGATSADTYTLAFRLVGNEEDARDVVQETYLRAYRGIGSLPGRRPVRDLALPDHRQLRLHHLGRRRRHRHDELLGRRADGRPRRPTTTREAQADTPARCATGWPTPWPTCRPACARSSCSADVYDLPHEAIAAELGISETAAKVRLHRARRRLRERLFVLPGEAEEPVTERSRAV